MFEMNRTKIKGDCQSGRKVVTHNSELDLPLVDSKRKIAINSKQKKVFLKEIIYQYFLNTGKSLLELWGTTFLPN